MVGERKANVIMNENFNLKFEPNPNGILQPDDLRFFYYDLGRLNLTNSSSKNHEWSNEIQSYLSENNIVIEPDVESDNNVEYKNNVIHLKMKNNESKENALIRHLRNAFAHYHVTKEGNYYILKDIDDKGISMIGKIECEHLKKIAFLLIEQNQIY